MKWNAGKALLPTELRKVISQALGRHKRPRVRRYIPHGVSVEQFFTSARDVECVVLRWFDTLPHVAMGEDIDLLVSDADFAKLGEFLNNIEGSVPCDIYSVSGLPGSQYKQRPYFPTKLAQSSPSRREFQGGLYPVPTPEDHFDGLAYHAVYQKGLASGLPTQQPGLAPMANPEHDYAGLLAALRDRLGIKTAITMEALDIYLAERGYRPGPVDLANLGDSNPWIVQHLLGQA